MACLRDLGSGQKPVCAPLLGGTGAKKKGVVVLENQNPLLGYESVLVLDPSWPVLEQKAFFKKLKETMVRFGGTLHLIDTWGVRKLANKNKKNLRQGVYFHLLFKGRGGVILELVRQIRLQESVIYFHFEKLPLKLTWEEHLKAFRQVIEDSTKREQDRQAQIQQRKARFAARKPGLEDSPSPPVRSHREV